MARNEENLDPRLQVRFAAHDPEAADEALEALAEFLVAVWLRQQGRPRGQEGSALPGD
jgi:hypothetical protein